MNWKHLIPWHKKTSQEEPRKSIPANAWLPIWEDSAFVQQIFASAKKKNPTSLQTEHKVKLVAYEYTSRLEEEPLPHVALTRVQELMDSFTALTTEDVIGLNPLTLTTPRVAKIENPVAIMSKGDDYFESEIHELVRLQHPRASELMSTLDLARNHSGDAHKNDHLQTLYAALTGIKKENPSLANDLAYAAGSARKPSHFRFHNKDYALLMSHFGDYVQNEDERTMGGGAMLPVLIPVEGYASLPFGGMFMAQVLGVLYFNPKPPFKNLGPGPVLVAAAISQGIPAPVDNR